MERDRRVVRCTLLQMLACAVIATAALGDDAPPPPQWVAVVAPSLRDSLRPLCEHRRQQGMKVVVLDTAEVVGKTDVTDDDAPALQRRVQELCRGWKGRTYVLLVGAVSGQGIEAPSRFVVPALKGSVERMKGEPTDNGYGCLDDDVVPEVAVGRFPARTPAEARIMVDKTLAGERNSQPGPWKRRLTVFAGAPSYNPVVDKLVESLAMSSFTRLDPAWSGNAIYHNEASAFVLPEERMLARAKRYLVQGQAFVVFLGHSGPEGIWGSWRGPLWLPLFDRNDWATVDLGGKPCVFATFGCNGAQLAGEDGEGYGVHAMRNPRGPVAVIGSHGSDWAAMALLMAEGTLLNLPGAHRSIRLGELWLAMKRHLATGYINPLVFHALDAADGSPGTSQAVQRLEHQEVFVLLGDPAFTLPAIPLKISLQVEGTSAPGAVLTVRGRVPPELAGAAGQVSVARPLAAPPTGLSPLPPEDSPDQRAAVMEANHNRANGFDLARADLHLTGQEFTAELRLPSELPWPTLVLRAYLSASQSEGMGVRTLEVQSSPSQPATGPDRAPSPPKPDK